MAESGIVYAPPAQPFTTDPLSDEEIATLRALIEKHGPNVVARRLQMRGDMVAAIAAGLNVRDGTRLLFRYRLHEARQRGEEL